MTGLAPAVVTTSADHAEKRRRLLAVLDGTGAEALALTGSTALAWYLDGARSHVSLAADPVLAVRVSRDADEVLLTSNETARLVREELPGWLTVCERPWYAGRPDLHARPETALADALLRARSPLLPVETERFARLGADAATALTDVLAVAEPSWTERRLAGEVARAVVERGADPLVVLVGGEDRAHLPHPLPTGGPLGRRVLVVLCARRHGLVVNLSRALAFGDLDAAERDVQDRVLAVEQAALDALAPGVTLAEVLGVVGRAYATQGFGADHWRGHHQGGVAGYAGRDPRATPDCSFSVAVGQAFAWNPWVPGGKVEDTVLLGDDGLEVLSVDPRWPSVRVGGRRRPVVWER
ncbi:Xaa-Pro aminopeptidase [Friedmanniella luteola]|uniref:Xaa-Pro aminopeptidase n=1 Tax=Friedmanniella luteola TaxID=546871 RepID=A0A1H1TMY9_9ACTN|nr:M24 family metallopeptidase [Friedmanniella luteola]SDS61695.1 Xaa-Pro aminopeptidase [Friedmanniella luteola]